MAIRLILEADRRRAARLAAGAVVLGLLPTLFTILSGWLVDAATGVAEVGGGLGSPAGREMVWALVAVAAVFVASEGLSNFHFAYQQGFRHQVDGRRTERVIAASLHPPGVSHLEDAEVHDLIQRCGTEQWPDPSHFTTGLLGMITVRTTALSSAVLVAWFHWWLAIGLLAVWLAVGRVMRQGQVEAFRDAWPRLRQIYYRREVAFHDWAAKEVRVFGLGGWLLDSFSRGWTLVMEDVWQRRRGVRRRQVRAFAVAVAANVVAFVILVEAVDRGEISAGRLVILAPAILALSQFGQTDEHTIPVALGAAVLPGLTELEERVRAPAYAAAGSQPADGLPAGDVTFEGVRFTYPTREQPVFDGLDLRIDAGRSLAVVGVNGAGKTTLVKLLARLYEPTGGRVTVDGIDVRQIDPRGWQRRVAAIFQDFIHYPFSAADNVGFGAVEHLDDRDLLERAAARVGALDLIDSLPHGWDTILTRRYVGGTDLSGGQWQRIALARALAAVEAGAGILVLDEPTAHLDVRAEVELFDQFLDVTRGATTVLISHRFSTVRRADRIVVLHRGRVVEDGSHQELVAAGGRYATAFRIQAERYEDLAGAPGDG
jgi:ATP-binding cassette subfamily B protein